jgi:hypothetical protein
MTNQDSNLEKPYGLDDMEAADALHNETAKSLNDDLNKCYAKCFNSEAGKKVLAHLKKCTIEQPAWVPGDGETGVHMAFLREGQNTIVRSIIDRIESITKLKD